ncbi:MAG: FAD-dependent oxidoreductase [Candidatus Lokiarchaeota archaeon]|nr:FAD-dependent oxidoreductase [Candidatus Lokiarchaeota archaeon]
MDKKKYITEPERKTEIIAEHDVIVVGGGPAGLCAAIASSRNGADTMLIEKNDFLGGQWTNPYSSYPGSHAFGISFQNYDGKQIIKGIGWEIIQRLMKKGGVAPLMKRKKDHVKFRGKAGTYLKYPEGSCNGPAILIPENLKGFALDLIEEENITLLLHTWAVDVIKKDNEIRGIIIQSKSGRQAILSKRVIDCSADADIAAAAGAPCKKESKDELWEMDYGLILGNINNKKVAQFLQENPDFLTASTYGGYHGWKERVEGDARITKDRMAVKTRFHRHEVSPGRKNAPILNNALGYTTGDPTNVRDLTNAEIEGRKDALKELAWLKENIPGYEYCIAIDRIGLGIRESRKIIGEYVITAKDVAGGKLFRDSIGLNNMPFDMHFADGSWINKFFKKTSEIPYRSLIPKEIDNLLVAGRCISCTHVAQSALRKVPICLATGEAAGTAAALSIKMNTLPRKLAVEDLQEKLRKQGAIVKLNEAPDWKCK